ncbi:MAG TPA: porin family protein [Chitinophagaceae bacterium]|nr:porin family protein [Chitinophagaceae bacterium]
MKKTGLSLIFCLMVALAMGQTTRSTNARPLSFYFGGGPTLSKFTGEEGDETKMLVGAQVALGLSLPVANNFSIVPELNVAMQGARYKVQESSFRLWYLNLPVLARYRFGQSGFFAETGPQIGLLLDAKRVVDDDKDDVSESFKSTSVNWNVGAGYMINENLAINLRVAPGLTDIDKSDNYSTKQFTSALRVLFSF